MNSSGGCVLSHPAPWWRYLRTALSCTLVTKVPRSAPGQPQDVQDQWRLVESWRNLFHHTNTEKRWARDWRLLWKLAGRMKNKSQTKYEKGECGWRAKWFASLFIFPILLLRCEAWSGWDEHCIWSQVRAPFQAPWLTTVWLLWISTAFSVSCNSNTGVTLVRRLGLRLRLCCRLNAFAKVTRKLKRLLCQWEEQRPPSRANSHSQSYWCPEVCGPRKPRGTGTRGCKLVNSGECVCLGPTSVCDWAVLLFCRISMSLL